MYSPNEIGRTLAWAFALFALVLALAAAWFLGVRRAAGQAPATANARADRWDNVPGAFPAPAWQPGFRSYFAPVRAANERANSRRP